MRTNPLTLVLLAILACLASAFDATDNGYVAWWTLADGVQSFTGTDAEALAAYNALSNSGLRCKLLIYGTSV